MLDELQEIKERTGWRNVILGRRSGKSVCAGDHGIILLLAPPRSASSSEDKKLGTVLAALLLYLFSAVSRLFLAIVHFMKGSKNGKINFEKEIPLPILLVLI